MNQTSSPVTVALTGQLPFIIIASCLFAFLVSLALLRLYRRAVVKSMRRHTAGAEALSLSPQVQVSETSVPHQGPALQIEVIRDFPPARRGREMPLYFAAAARPWQAALIYGIAGICFAGTMSAAFFLSAKMEINYIRVLAITAAYLWPAVLTTNLVAARTHRLKGMIVVVYFAAFAAINGIALVKSRLLTLDQVLVYWSVYNVPPTVLLAIFLNRRIRAVGPLVLTFMIVGISGASVAVSLAGSNQQLLHTIAQAGFALGLGAKGVLFGLNAIGFVPFAVIAWLVLGRIRTLYETKRISDQSLNVDSIWLIFGLANSIDFVFAGAWWILSGLVAFVIFKLCANAGFRLCKRFSTTPHAFRKLLLLRVFSLGKRSEELFDMVGKSWRFVGSIQMIAGPDLAASTVEPHEILDFLSGKLARRFIDSAKTLDLRISQMDLEPYLDNRLRVNDFFCHDDTWKMTLARLADDSDAVLMDLRGFSQKNAGCIFEINELFNLVPLQRVVFAVDETTDQRFLQSTLQQAWNGMKERSPNRRLASPQATLIHLGGSGAKGTQHLLYAVCKAAESPDLR